MYRHLKICKKNPVNTDDMEAKVTIMQQQINDLQRQLLQRPAALAPSPPSTITTNTINNTQNIQNQNINITINNFGREDISYLSHEFLSDCLMNPRRGMASLIENIHYHDEHADNHNLRCKSLKQNIFEKYVDAEWIACDASNTLDELIRKGYRILNTHFTDNFLNDPDIFDNEARQRELEHFRFLSDTSCQDYFAVKRELRLLVKNKTVYLIASPDTQITDENDDINDINDIEGDGASSS
jgi:hypothetical protein